MIFSIHQIAQAIEHGVHYYDSHDCDPSSVVPAEKEIGVCLSHSSSI